MRHHGGWRARVTATPGARWLGLAGALLLLNCSLTFANVWPTPAIRLTAQVSVEAVLAVLVLAMAGRWLGGRARLVVWGGAALWLALVLGRYVEVTTASLYGRDISLYWDLRHMPAVGAMFAEAADVVVRARVVAAVLLVPVALYLALAGALAVIVAAAREEGTRRWLGGVAVVALVLGGIGRVSDRLAPLRVADPVLGAYARELGELGYELSGAGLRDLGPPPELESDFSRLGGADVLLIFLESYGAVAWDRPELADALAPSRTRLAADIEDTGRRVASAFVESPTFAGESWLAHITLLSGTEVRDQGTNVRLMAQQRDTLVKLFGRRGHRTIAIMPGLLVGWPEGEFYGFEKIYDHAALGYRGPPFGWWDVNDQFALARVDAAEIAPPARPPAFVFFASITTHTPFVPTPPYQPDWKRVLSDTPYDAEALDAAWSAWPDWSDLGPSYVTAFEYAFATVGGYLRLRADRDLVMILVGDHQPPALVSGEGASWEVPVHVIANRPAVIDRLVSRHHFVEGLAPAHPAAARMDGLLPMLLDAFGD